MLISTGTGSVDLGMTVLEGFRRAAKCSALHRSNFGSHQVHVPPSQSKQKGMLREVYIQLTPMKDILHITYVSLLTAFIV